MKNTWGDFSFEFFFFGEGKKSMFSVQLVSVIFCSTITHILRYRGYKHKAIFENIGNLVENAKINSLGICCQISNIFLPKYEGEFF